MEAKEEEARRLEDEKRRLEARDENRPPKVVTWNVQKTSLRENNRRRLREIVTYCVEKKWDAVMLTEITSQEEGLFWLGEDEKKAVVVHGKKTAILLTGRWATDWTNQGSLHWVGNRVSAVKVNNFRLVSGYQPLWSYGAAEMDAYRVELDEQIEKHRTNEWLIFGGDHNATVGRPNQGEINNWNVAGRYGLGQRNDAGRDLLRWCEGNGLAWVNSFYMHNWRGTWFHPARNMWYELDGFMMKKPQMGFLVQAVRTVMEDSFSDHRPKMLILRARRPVQPRIHHARNRRTPKINWEALQDEGKRGEYKEKTEEKMRQVDQTDIKWEKIAQVMTTSALEVCGKRQKELSTPWVAGREERLVELRQGISEAVQRVREMKIQCENENIVENRQSLEEAIVERKIRRREHRITLRAWEREYWEDMIENMREAQERGNYGEVYRTLRKLGNRGTSKAPPSTYFTPEEFKEHFAKVSEHEFEKDADNWTAALGAVDDRRNQAKNKAAGERLDVTPSETEIWKAVKEMKDRAPGEDEVRISYIKSATEAVQKYVMKLVQNMFQTNPENWEDMVSVGLVIALFKKGDRKDRNNYRGVCLLSMLSRKLARVLATRIRNWSEEIGLVEDNQQGFRSGRSTMDATQIMIRIQEEMSEIQKDKRALNRDTSDTPEDAGAVLLDITKAYPRVNRPAMWAVLEKAGMREKCLSTVKGLHERTTYKVKGREECSTMWIANRGLREGCATSPTLFNIYHAEVMRQAKRNREAECTNQGREAGIKWKYIPGNAFPPISANKAMTSSDAEEVNVTEALFADDTTLIGARQELQQNVTRVKETMGSFEEKCHDGKEEWVFFGKDGSENIRMLGTWLGREKDVRERLARGNRAWWMLKKRLRKSTIPQKTQARVIEACVESTMLFDCAARPWLRSEIKRLQQQIDRSYRYVWMDKNGGPGLCQMEAKGVNMYDIRHKLGVDTVETKIAKRTMERIGHVIRMDNKRITKKVILGWPKKEQPIQGRKSTKNTTITFWRKTLKQAGVDPDTMETTAMDRGRWKGICQEDGKRRKKVDKSKGKETSGQQDTATTVAAGTTTEEFRCDWPGCGNSFEKKMGLIHHQRIKHKRLELKFECPTCTRAFKQKSNLTNHIKNCRGVPSQGQCRWCQKTFSKSNIARHERNCPKNRDGTQYPSSQPEDERTETRNTRTNQQTEPPDPGEERSLEPRPKKRRTENTLHTTGEQTEASGETLSNQQTETLDPDEWSQPTEVLKPADEKMEETVPKKRKVERCPKYPCCVCGREVRGGVKCNAGGMWCHFGCAKEKYAAIRNWSATELDNWKCPRH